jgi:hypothetical protein
MRVRNNEACAVSRSNSRIHRFDAALLRQGNLKASVVSEKPNKYARRHEYGLSHFRYLEVAWRDVADHSLWR